MTFPVLVPVHIATSSVRSNQSQRDAANPIYCILLYETFFTPMLLIHTKHRVLGPCTEFQARTFFATRERERRPPTLTRAWYLVCLPACRPILPYGYAAMLAPAPALVHTCIPLSSNTVLLCVVSGTRRPNLTHFHFHFHSHSRLTLNLNLTRRPANPSEGVVHGNPGHRHDFRESLVPETYREAAIETAFNATKGKSRQSTAREPHLGGRSSRVPFYASRAVVRTVSIESTNYGTVRRGGWPMFQVVVASTFTFRETILP
jgi:hypothetical protein